MKECQIGGNFQKNQQLLLALRDPRKKSEPPQLEWKSVLHLQIKLIIKASQWELWMIIKKLGNENMKFNYLRKIHVKKLIIIN